MTPARASRTERSFCGVRHPESGKPSVRYGEERVPATIMTSVLPDGIYELRARAEDLAGNDRSTDGGRTGTRSGLPLRIKTSLRVGKRKRVRARTVGKRRYRIVLIEEPRSRYGRTILLRGRPTSPGGNPLVGRNVDVLAQTRLPAAPWRPIAHFERARPVDLLSGHCVDQVGRSGSASTAATLPWPNRDRAVGRPCSFIHFGRPSPRRQRRGRDVPGSPSRTAVASSGKLIEVQARARGRWLTFGTTRADARTGRWSLRTGSRRRAAAFVTASACGSRRSPATRTRRGPRARSASRCEGSERNF